MGNFKDELLEGWTTRWLQNRMYPQGYD